MLQLPTWWYKTEYFWIGIYLTFVHTIMQLILTGALILDFQTTLTGL
jgi:hypothetical protein